MNTHTYFSCVFYEMIANGDITICDTMLLLLPQTHSEKRERELPHIQKLACYVCLSTKIYDNQSQHLTSLFQLLFAHKMQTLFCRVNKKKSWRDFHFAKLNKIYKISFVYLNNDPELFSFCFLKQFPFLFKIRDDKLMIIIIGAI